MAKSLDAKREELTNEIRDILKNAEELFNETSDSSTEEYKKLKHRLAKQFDDVKDRFATLKDDTVDNARAVAKHTDTLVQDNPYKAITVAGVVGLLLGVLVARR
ncbi:TPA: YqjD family protein [Mannheimia haemolytica]